MARVTLIAATTDAVTDRELNARAYESFIIGATNLATTEEVDIKLNGKAITDSSGVVKKLTASIPHIVVEGGDVYHIDKDVTAGACEVFVTHGRGFGEA